VPEEDPEASHRRSVHEVTDYGVAAAGGAGGEAGRAVDFIVVGETWALRFLVVEQEESCRDIPRGCD
jgi:hypothetical protein